MLVSTSAVAFTLPEHEDDTIRIKTKDNSEIIIIVNDINDVGNLSLEIDAVMGSLDEVFERLEEELDGLDSVINVTVKGADKRIVVEIDGMEENQNRMVNFDINIDDEPKKEKKLHGFTSMDFGFNNYLQNGKFPNDFNAQYAVKPWGSWNVALGAGLRWYVAKPFSVDIAADFSWYNFKYQDRATRITKTDDNVVFSRDLTGDDYQKSKTTVPYLNISLTPMVHFGKKNSGVNHRDFRIGAGVYAGYRLGGSVKYIYDVDNIEMKYRQKGDYFLNTYRYGVKAIFGYSDVNFFASYDLSTLYATNKGPELNPICFGLNWTF
jgi:hypothetical protein